MRGASPQPTAISAQMKTDNRWLWREKGNEMRTSNASSAITVSRYHTLATQAIDRFLTG
jgi:hypothetical protein